ncbi:MAG: translation elongation factor-like protein [Patescibacteria group bacterium]|nr:translation elongation factor-like protein [Patescibacteria group bacterium]
MANKKIGFVSHFYDKINVAIIELSAALKKGDLVKFKKEDEEFEQTVVSMQLDHKEIEKAKKGDSLGLKVDKPVKVKTELYLVS